MKKPKETARNGLLIADYCTEQAVSALADNGSTEIAIASALISIAHSLTAIGMMKTVEDDSDNKRRHICTFLFNRCYTTNRGEMCKYCVCREECEKERTVDKDESGNRT